MSDTTTDGPTAAFRAEDPIVVIQLPALMEAALVCLDALAQRYPDAVVRHDDLGNLAVYPG